MNLAQRFARVATAAVARQPRLWPLFRTPIRRMFERYAPTWDASRSPDRTRALEAGLDELPAAPGRVLDLGTGTGDGAFLMARRWPEAEVVGVDLAERMVAEAREKTPAELRSRVRFDVGDASRLPVHDASFDLVAMNNMIPFVRELARVTAPTGHVVIAYSRGAETPIYVPPEQLRAELERHGFDGVRDLAAGAGTAVVARRRARQP